MAKIEFPTTPISPQDELRKQQIDGAVKTLKGWLTTFSLKKDKVYHYCPDCHIVDENGKVIITTVMIVAIMNFLFVIIVQSGWNRFPIWKAIIGVVIALIR